MTNEQQMAAIRRVAEIVLDAVREAGPGGAPESFIYLALETHGATHHQCNELITALINLGHVRREPGPVLVAV